MDEDRDTKRKEASEGHSVTDKHAGEKERGRESQL